EVEQAGHANDDVQPEAQQHVDADGAQVVVPVAAEDRRQEQHDADQDSVKDDLTYPAAANLPGDGEALVPVGGALTPGAHALAPRAAPDAAAQQPTNSAGNSQ